MYERKNLTSLKIMQKAGEFQDLELSSEALVNSLLAGELNKIDKDDKTALTQIINSLVEAKEKAKLSKWLKILA